MKVKVTQTGIKMSSLVVSSIIPILQEISLKMLEGKANVFIFFFGVLLLIVLFVVVVVLFFLFFCGGRGWGWGGGDNEITTVEFSPLNIK